MLMALGLSGVILLLVLIVTFEAQPVLNFQPSNSISPFYVGIEIGWRANVTDAKALIDQVKNYTNLLIIASPIITSNEICLDQTCDYAYNANMSIMVYWDSSEYSPQEVANTEPHQYHPYEWIVKAKEKYGRHFLGAYFLDEPAGRKLDESHTFAATIYLGEQPKTPTSYSDYARAFVENSYLKNFSAVNHQVGSLLFTADYGLYWFDYKAGYDVVLAELGWNHSRSLQVALARGAATAQSKDWGVMITWTYNQPPYLESGAELYNDLVLAYECGAKYAAIYDASQKWANSTLTEEHYEALQNFWSYIKQNPQKQASVKADTVLILPKDYGFGFRSVNDKIWGLDQADKWTNQIYNDVIILLNERGLQLDIVYNDPDFTDRIASHYDDVLYWDAGSEASNYQVVNLRSTMGYSTIQEAINSPATYAGDTLYVKSGVYYENVVVDKSIVLIGQDRTAAIIDGGNNGTTLLIASDNVTLTGFTLRNGNSSNSRTSGGLVLDNANNCNITQNIIVDSNRGIYLNNSANNLLRNNVLSNNRFNFGVSASTFHSYLNDIDTSNTINGKPIYYWINQHDQMVPFDAGYVALINCTRVVAQNLNLSNNINGLLLAYTQASTVTNNSLTDNYEGMRIDGCSNSILRSNTMQDNIFNLWISSGYVNDIDSSNTVDSKQVIYWIDEHDKTVPDNAGYVALINCQNITVQNLELSNNGQGILLYNTTNSTINQNLITYQCTGIELDTSTNNNITQNVIKTNADNGIKIASSDDNNILKNTLTNNDANGIYVYGSSNNQISQNNITANNCGISFQNSTYANTTFNHITKNLISANGKFVNMQYGGAKNNTLYHNNFVNNLDQLPKPETTHTIFGRAFAILSEITTNSWDNGKEGNYWSDYSGVDANQDGIGDTAHYIRNMDYDNYPLMQSLQFEPLW